MATPQKGCLRGRDLGSTQTECAGRLGVAAQAMERVTGRCGIDRGNDWSDNNYDYDGERTRPAATKEKLL